MTADDDPGYLEEAAALLREQRTALERKAEMEEVSDDPAFHRSLSDERFRLAEDFARLAAIKRGIAPDTSPAADARLAAVLRFADHTALAESRYNLEWIIDQMVRAATGCPEDPTVAGLGTSPAYERFREQVGEWSEGMAP